MLPKQWLLKWQRGDGNKLLSDFWPCLARGWCFPNWAVYQSHIPRARIHLLVSDTWPCWISWCFLRMWRTMLNSQTKLLLPSLWVSSINVVAGVRWCALWQSAFVHSWILLAYKNPIFIHSHIAKLFSLLLKSFQLILLSFLGNRFWQFRFLAFIVL